MTTQQQVRTQGQAGAQTRLPEEGEWFDLIPAEKKLIRWSLGLGLVLLAVLIYVSYYVIPVPH